MKRELETKFAIRDEKAFLSVLERHGIHLTEPVEQRDIIYFRKGKGFSDLPHGEPVLRIRQVGNAITTTLKIYRNGVSDRTEVECGITDQIAFDEYLKCLGFDSIVEVIKKRRKGTFSGATIVLDEVCRLGHFAEIEVVTSDDGVSDGIEKLRMIVEHLGFDGKDAFTVPYDEMLYNKTRGERF